LAGGTIPLQGLCPNIIVFGGIGKTSIKRTGGKDPAFDSTGAEGYRAFTMKRGGEEHRKENEPARVKGIYWIGEAGWYRAYCGWEDHFTQTLSQFYVTTGASYAIP